MNLHHLLHQFFGSGDTASSAGEFGQGIGGQLPGGVAGSAEAGGAMPLLQGHKSPGETAGKAASFCGSALLGGLAYKAYFNWQHNKGKPITAWCSAESGMLERTEAATPVDSNATDFQLQLIKSMIAAAKADGHIDPTRQQCIYQVVEEMELTTEFKGIVFDLMRQPITVDELAAGATSIEQRSEIYLVSCLVIHPDYPCAQAYFDQLESALELPEGLAEKLQWQAQRVAAKAP